MGDPAAISALSFQSQLKNKPKSYITELATSSVLPRKIHLFRAFNDFASKNLGYRIFWFLVRGFPAICFAHRIPIGVLPRPRQTH